MPTLTIEAIKDAIARLGNDEKLSLASWLNLQMTDDWDRQMQRDLALGGKGQEFLKQVKREVAEGISNGTVRPIEEGFAERRRKRT